MRGSAVILRLQRLTMLGVIIVVMVGAGCVSSARGDSRADGGAPTAAAYAQQLVDNAPIAENSTEQQQSPDPALDGPSGQEYDFTGTVRRPRWWVVDQPEQATLDQLRAQMSLCTSVNCQWGTSETSGRKPVQFLDHDVRHPPSTIYAALLDIDVVALNDSQSAVAVFGFAVPQTKRAKREDVPTGASLREVRLVVRDRYHQDSVVRTRSETGKHARSLAKALNNLVVRPTGGTPLYCPKSPKHVTTVDFIAAHHHWTATPNPCRWIDVTRDGHQLAALDPTGRYLRLVSRDVHRQQR